MPDIFTVIHELIGTIGIILILAAFVVGIFITSEKV